MISITVVRLESYNRKVIQLVIVFDNFICALLIFNSILLTEFSLLVKLSYGNSIEDKQLLGC